MVTPIAGPSQLSLLANIQKKGKQEQDLMEKLTTGKRVNKGSDDPTALARIQQLNSALRGLDQGSENASYGASTLDTASGGLSNILEGLQSLREVALRSTGNDLSTTDRSALVAQGSSLTQGINDVAGSVNMDGKNLLDGSFQNKAIQVGDSSGQTVPVSIGSATTTALGISGFDVSTSAAATTSLGQIDTAISQVTSQMSTLGSTSTRLQNSIEGNQRTAENLAQAKSTKEDLDYAQAIGQLKAVQINKTAAIQALALSNNSTKTTLKLIV